MGNFVFINSKGYIYKKEISGSVPSIDENHEVIEVGEELYYKIKIGNRRVDYWEVEVVDEEADHRQMRIDELQSFLDNSDYKVLKNLEYEHLGKPIPYDIEELHTERESWRDEINQLRGDINMSP